MTYDLIIIGGGAAGFSAAYRAEELGIKTLMINDSSILPLGGTCVNVGCIPSKIMLYQATLLYQSIKNRFRALALQGSADFVDALEETRHMAKIFQEKNYQRVLLNLKNTKFIEARARLSGPDRVVAGNSVYEAEHILIATGASTFIPAVKGIRDVDYLTNRTVFNLEKKPDSIVIIGGGSEAVEFAQIFHRFGIKTTLIQRSQRILTRFDAQVALKLQDILVKEGVEIITNTKLLSVTGNKSTIAVTLEQKNEGVKTIVAEMLLIATGLRGNTSDIGLETAGIKPDERGFVKVNEYLQTEHPRVYAAGDVTGIMPLETVAARQGALAVHNMFNNDKKSIDYNLVPQAVFTEPELASVGVTEEAYTREHGRCLCSSLDLNDLERASLEKQTDGLIKMVVAPDTREILGVQMVGQRASDVITTATYAIKNRMTIYDIRDTVHIFPTISEALKKVAQSFDRDPKKMPCCIE